MPETQTTSIIPLESMQLADAALDFCKSIQIVEIKTVDQCEAAAKLLREIASYTNQLEDERKKVKEPHLQAGKAVDKFFKDPTVVLIRFKNKLDTAIRLYTKALDDERKRRQEELDRKAAEDRRKAKEAAQKEREKADLYREQGRDDMADKAEGRAQIKEQTAETIVAPIAQVATPKIDGISTRANWKMVINDPVLFVQYCVDNKLYHLLTFNQTSCNAWAESIRQAMKYPGAEVLNDEHLTIRGL